MTMMTMKMLLNDKKSTITIEMNTDINAIKILMLNTGATRKATDKDTHGFTYIVRLDIYHWTKVQQKRVSRLSVEPHIMHVWKS